MAGPINQARAKISKIFNGEPRSYTRFNLAQNTDGDNSHVEVKLSGDGEEEIDETEAGPHRSTSTFTLKPLRTYKKIFYVALACLFFFFAGYLIGYVTHTNPDAGKLPSSEGVQSTSLPSEEGEDEEEIVHSSEPVLDWSGIKRMLQKQLSSEVFDQKLSEFAVQFPEHEAGSSGDFGLANKVLSIFRDLEMTPWYDQHYVQLQVPSRASPNEVFLNSEAIGQPKGYLAYSGTGTVSGKVVYANYAKNEDLTYLQHVGIDLRQSVALIRAGKISLAEKVANAAKFGAAAVLIYLEPADEYEGSIDLYGHVHFGTGDPYTPGFPSFNQTQFPPSKSSGLPEILAQTITADMALKIHQKLGGKAAPSNFEGNLRGLRKYNLGGENDLVNVTVNNVLNDTRILNVFGVIKGVTEPDRYVVIGAQRDSFSKGFAKSTVGTCLLVELAKAIAQMKKEGFRPRRSIVFASWSAADYGTVGATEWLEGYLTSLDKKAFTYISLDGAVLGASAFRASASPLLYSLLRETLNEVKSPSNSEMTLFQRFAGNAFENELKEPMKMQDGAYPFLAFSGIPSISFRFVSDTTSSDYKYYGTVLDNKEKLDIATQHQLGDYCVSAAQVAGQMALRLVHDHLLRLDVTSYTGIIKNHVNIIKDRVSQLKQAGIMSKPLTSQWLNSAAGSYSRAANALVNGIMNSDLEDAMTCRRINDLIMKVEHNMLSPYVSPREVPFRHIFFGTGELTVSALTDHLKDQVDGSDADLLRNQFALTTWTIQGCANDLAGDVWSLNN